MIYCPYSWSLEVVKKLKNRDFDPDFVAQVGQLDKSELIQRELKIARGLAKSLDYQFTHLGTDRAIFCESCGKLLDVDNIVFRRRKR